jgi:hypothetical protein
MHTLPDMAAVDLPRSGLPFTVHEEGHSTGQRVKHSTASSQEPEVFYALYTVLQDVVLLI